MGSRMLGLVLALGLAGVAMGGGLGGPGGAGGAVPATAAGPMDAARWAALVGQLAEADFARREAAQRELEKIDWRQMAFLKEAAEGATDPEIKARLAARVSAMEEDLAVNPPPISLNLKNASLLDVCEEISKAVGVRIEPYPNRDNLPNVSFTLAAGERPFWDAFFQLSRQQPLGFVNSSNQQMLSTSSGTMYAFGAVSGPLAVFPTTLSRTRSVALQNPGGPQLSPETVNLNCVLMLDPRVRVVRYSQPVFTEIVDELGNTLLAQKNVQPPTNEYSSSGRSLVQLSVGTSMRLPEKRGTKIASAKGVVRLAVQTAEERLDIKDLEKKVGQNVDFGGAGMRLRSFNVEASGPNGPFSVNVYLMNDVANRGGLGGIAGGVQPGTVTLSLIDATGKVVYSTTTRGGTSFSTSGNMTLPLTLRLSAASKTKEVTLPFELKDLPLP